MYHFYSIPSISHGRIQDANNVKESALAAFWEKVKPGTVMKDRFGNFVTVFSPGRQNKNEGPDFLDAVIWVNGEMIKGAVEIHSHESYWISHGHFSDNRYDGVILHVVSTFARQPVLYVTTIQFDIHSFEKSYECLLPNQSLTPNQMIVLMEFGLKRWDEKVLFFKKSINEKRKLVFIESLVNFGAGENRQLYRKLGNIIFPYITKNISKDTWVKTFIHFSSPLHWHRAGTMPARHPQRIIKRIAQWSFDYFMDAQEDLTLQQVKQGFEDYGFGETTWVEWCGNVYFPATAGESHSDYTSYFERWTKLQLPYTYGSLNRLFGNNLTRKQLRSFHIAQGLLYLKSHYCFGWHCKVCKVKRSL